VGPESTAGTPREAGSSSGWGPSSQEAQGNRGSLSKKVRSSHLRGDWVKRREGYRVPTDGEAVSCFGGRRGKVHAEQKRRRSSAPTGYREAQRFHTARRGNDAWHACKMGKRGDSLEKNEKRGRKCTSLTEERRRGLKEDCPRKGTEKDYRPTGATGSLEERKRDLSPAT